MYLNTCLKYLTPKDTWLLQIDIRLIIYELFEHLSSHHEHNLSMGTISSTQIACMLCVPSKLRLKQNVCYV